MGADLLPEKAIAERDGLIAERDAARAEKEKLQNLYEQMRHQLKTPFGSERAAAVFTDPPYNVRINGHAVGKGRKTQSLRWRQAR